MIPSQLFYQAVFDYLFLLEKKYPQKQTLKTVSDRYALNTTERIMLFRGTAILTKRNSRKTKIILDLQPNSHIYIDGFNVIRTIGSYLNGNWVFIGMDGFLRDASELHRKKLKWEKIVQTVDLIFDFFIKKNIQFVNFYFDTPISHSGKLSALITEKINNNKLDGDSQTVFSPDKVLIERKNGIICTGDSNIIDYSQVPIYDLAHEILKYFFHSEIFSLENI